jgi:hypothetical protein
VHQQKSQNRDNHKHHDQADYAADEIAGHDSSSQ